jgi:hypothetical protein
LLFCDFTQIKYMSGRHRRRNETEFRKKMFILCLRNQVCAPAELFFTCGNGKRAENCKLEIEIEVRCIINSRKLHELSAPPRGTAQRANCSLIDSKREMMIPFNLQNSPGQLIPVTSSVTPDFLVFIFTSLPLISISFNSSSPIESVGSYGLGN